MRGEHHAKARPLDAPSELLERDRLRARALAGEILDQRAQALQIGGALGLAQVAAQAPRPTLERLDREPLDQLLDHRQGQRAGIDSVLDREGEQLDGIARRVGVGAPAQPARVVFSSVSSASIGSSIADVGGAASSAQTWGPGFQGCCHRLGPPSLGRAAMTDRARLGRMGRNAPDALFRSFFRARMVPKRCRCAARPRASGRPVIGDQGRARPLQVPDSDARSSGVRRGKVWLVDRRGRRRGRQKVSPKRRSSRPRPPSHRGLDPSRPPTESRPRCHAAVCSASTPRRRSSPRSGPPRSHCRSGYMAKVDVDRLLAIKHIAKIGKILAQHVNSC